MENVLQILNWEDDGVEILEEVKCFALYLINRICIVFISHVNEFSVNGGSSVYISVANLPKELLHHLTSFDFLYLLYGSFISCIFESFTLILIYS